MTTDEPIYQPYHQEAEECVIGALLTNPSAMHELMAMVSAEDFFFPANRIIFDAAKRLDDNRMPIDASLVINQLSATNKLELAGGLSYLASLAHNVAVPKNILHYAKYIKDKRRERDVLAIANAMQREITAGDGDTDTRINNALSLSVTADTSAAVEKGKKDFLKESKADFMRRHENNGEITGLKSGFTYLDERYQGFQPGQLIIMAGRPASGKTTLALNFATYAALNNDGATLFFSLEMSGKELVDKLLCSVGRINYGLFRRGFPKAIAECELEWSKLNPAFEQVINRVDMIIDDRSNLTIQQIRSKSIREKRKAGKIKAVFIDYLTLIRTPGKDNRVLEVGAISRALKNLAKELECPVIALAQLSRKVEERSDKRPLMSDLRDSGEIEQDADIVMFIYRDEVYNENSPDFGTAEIITAKNRAGETGIDRISADLKHSRFCNLATDWRPSAPQQENTYDYRAKVKK